MHEESTGDGQRDRHRVNRIYRERLDPNDEERELELAERMRNGDDRPSPTPLELRGGAGVDARHDQRQLQVHQLKKRGRVQCQFIIERRQQ